MKFYRASLFILTLLNLCGLDSASNKQVPRPFSKVVEAIDAVVPETEENFKKSLAEFIKSCNNKANSFEAPELGWLLLQEWLQQNISSPSNREPWELTVIDIFKNTIDYKNYITDIKK